MWDPVGAGSTAYKNMNIERFFAPYFSTVVRGLTVWSWSARYVRHKIIVLLRWV